MIQGRRWGLLLERLVFGWADADSSSESGFTSPNHLDLLTKKDGKTILLNLQETDDDADVENGCDDMATPSNSLGNSPDLFGFSLSSLQHGKVIAYASRQLKPYEVNYPTYDLELAAEQNPI
ncbi:hypothetical protein Tco_0173253 [Tanacetum coccineum]